MNERERALALRHDVSKYILRVAMNVDQSCPPGLLTMLLADLYGPPDPSARFEALAVGIEATEITLVRQCFAELRSLKEDIGAGEAAAVSRGLALAREIASKIDRLTAPVVEGRG